MGSGPNFGEPVPLSDDEFRRFLSCVRAECVHAGTSNLILITSGRATDVDVADLPDTCQVHDGGTLAGRPPVRERRGQ